MGDGGVRDPARVNAAAVRTVQPRDPAAAARYHACLRAAFRETMIDYRRDSRLRRTPEPRQAAAARIYELLEEKNRMKLFAQALWQI